jgi:hypothetical protein
LLVYPKPRSTKSNAAGAYGVDSATCVQQNWVLIVGILILFLSSMDPSSYRRKLEQLTNLAFFLLKNLFL